MLEAEYDDEVQGTVVLSWDGSVLEVFTERLASTARLHRRLLHLDVKGPDRRGRYEVRATSQPRGRGAGATLFVPAEGWPDVEERLRVVVAESDVATA